MMIPQIDNPIETLPYVAALWGSDTAIPPALPVHTHENDHVKPSTTVAYRVAYRVRPHLAYSSSDAWSSPYEQFSCSR